MKQMKKKESSLTRKNLRLLSKVSSLEKEIESLESERRQTRIRDENHEADEYWSRRAQWRGNGARFASIPEP
jgi:hypothetical protein